MVSLSLLFLLCSQIITHLLKLVALGLLLDLLDLHVLPKRFVNAHLYRLVVTIIVDHGCSGSSHFLGVFGFHEVILENSDLVLDALFKILHL